MPTRRPASGSPRRFARGATTAIAPSSRTSRSRRSSEIVDRRRRPRRGEALRSSAGRRSYEGVSLTRELVTEPANIIYPESFVERVSAVARRAPASRSRCSTARRWRSSAWARCSASRRARSAKARLLILKWNGGGEGGQPIAFVGKGVTFDTGGISIKPAAGMEAMKWDMGGAGAVVGAMKALALRKAKANVVGICGLVENMPDGNAQRPGDVVTTMSGQTVEVINTDAEGRLVLADAITYVQRNYKPATIVDLATLTGAMIDQPRPRMGGPVLEQRRARRQAARGRRGVGRQTVAHAAGRAVRPADRFADRRHEERRPARGRLDHRRAVHPALHRERRALGAYRHRRHGLVGQGRARPTTRARPATACACSTEYVADVLEG